MTRNIKDWIALLGSFILDGGEIDLSGGGGDKILAADVGRVAWEAGIKFESIQGRVLELEKTKVKSVLDKVVLTIEDRFWRRVAPLVALPALAGAGGVFSRAVLEGVELSIVRVSSQESALEETTDNSEVVDIGLTLASFTLLQGGKICCEVYNVKLGLYGVNLKNIKESIVSQTAVVYLDSLECRLYDRLLNGVVRLAARILEGRGVSSLAIRFDSQGGIVVSGTVTKGIAFPVGIELIPAEDDGSLRVFLKSITLGGKWPFLGGVRYLVEKLVKRLQAKYPEVSARGEYVFIRPWERLPVKLKTQLLRFRVIDGVLSIVLGPVAGRTPLREFSALMLP